MDSKEVRRLFVEFFENRGHKNWASSSVVPLNDPTLLFVNSGMCQFKPKFLGDIDKSTEFGRMTRACNTQKCIRAGGKHNDLDDVGQDVYHHTFFEMLGNWSFGDYFKEEAISYAWTLLTEVYKLPKDRLYATYFQGDKALGLPADTDAQSFWRKLLPESHIVPGNAKDNFWEMGDTGPCGPCSEIHFDRIGGRECPELVNKDDPDVLEIWNLVFMQFNREPSGKLTALPAGCIDTGMGLERLTSILCNVKSNYDTDLFVPLFRKIHILCGEVPHPYSGKVGAEDPDRIDLAYRVVADHVRTVTCSIADGVIPSNDGRGYVIRRVLRRALRYGRQILGAPKTELWFGELVDIVVESLGCAFPELIAHRDKIKKIIADEEQQFGRTLDRGTALFQRAIKSLKEGEQLEGRVAFELFATYGFPLDLTKLLCDEHGLTVDNKGFEAAMAQHQKSSEGDGSRVLLQTLTPDKLAYLEKTCGILPTHDSHKFEWISSTGDGPEQFVTVKALYHENEFIQNGDMEKLNGSILSIVLDKTNFYAESGGQIGDMGWILGIKGEFEIEIVDTKRMGAYVLHAGRLLSGTISVGDQAITMVDFQRRALVAKNHTATHCLNFVLRDVLGDSVDQAGSVVEPSKLRFDFTYTSQLSTAQLGEIETKMRDIIGLDLPVHMELAPLSQAKAICGLRSVFGENYPDPVRVVTVGKTLAEVSSGEGSNSGLHASVEFCGGTHISRTIEIEWFTILSEESISRGVRRIVAATARTARDACDIGEGLLALARYAATLPLPEAISEMTLVKEDFNTKKDQIPLMIRKEITDLLEGINSRKIEEGKARIKALKKQGELLGQSYAAKTSAEKFIVFNGPTLCGDFKALEEFVAAVSGKPVLIISSDTDADRTSLLCSVPKAQTKLGHASDWIAAAIAGGNAKAGGKDVNARGTSVGCNDVERFVCQALDFARKTFC